MYDSTAPTGGGNQGALFEVPQAGGAGGHAAGPMVAGCCSCGASIERPLNGPRPACTHAGRVAAEAAARQFAGALCSERMAANFARWFVGTDHSEADQHAAAYGRWRTVMGHWFDLYEAEEQQAREG